MSTEEATSPAADVDTSKDGVAAAADATTDDLDTETFDRMEAPDDDEADAAGDASGEGDADDPDKATPAVDPDVVEIEYDGVNHKVPVALKDAFLRQDDYTKKTQEVAEQRRALETERSTWETQQAESRAALPAEYQRVAVLNSEVSALTTQMEAFKEVDWDTFRAQAAADPDAKLRYETIRDRYSAARDRLTDLRDEIGEATKDLSTKEEARLQEQRTKADTALDEARKQTGATLAKEIPGWNQDLAAKTVEFALSKDVGLTLDEIPGMTDPRVWKLLHFARTAKEDLAKAQTALKQKTTADNHGKAQATTPAVKPGGGGNANPRDPSTPRGDDLSTKLWMERRERQIAAKQAGR